MRIGVIGAGKIGGTLARHFAAAGHDVAISNSRGPDTLRELESELGDRARAATPPEAARFGEIAVVAVPFKSYTDLPADELSGKIVIDTTNYYPRRDGNFEEIDSGRTTSSELIAQHLPGAAVVKAFNTIRWDHLRDRAVAAGDASNRIGIPIAGDDLEAKQAVDELIEEIGFDGVDAGSLAEGGRKLQPGGPVTGAVLPSGELAAMIAV